MEILKKMVDTGFGGVCRGTSFCSVCRPVACHRCCASHVDCHHAGVGGMIEVAVFNGVAPVSAHAIKKGGGFGYDWRHIQRVTKRNGEKIIMLSRHPADQRNKSFCRECNCPVSTKSLYCTPSCKVIAVPRGQSLDIIQDLVRTNFKQGALRDRFCLVCMVAFSSAHCPDHIVHEHAANAAVIELVHHDGWMLIKDDLVGAHLLDGISRIDVGGIRMVPVRMRTEPNSQGPNRCAGLGCLQSVEHQGEACSIICRLDN